MLRNIDINEISDGRLYNANDMVKADCGGCQGCFACCCGMGTSIVLDPLDLHRLCDGLHQSAQELLTSGIELNVSDGIILPNIKMAGSNEACSFLDADGRCSIHAFRPGICRLFPLGRFYENNDFQYFLQVHECPKQNKSKIKVRKWIDTPDFADYEAFIRNWHYFLKPLQEYAMTSPDADKTKTISMYILQNFYLLPFETDDFYSEFDARLKKAMEFTDSIL